MFRVSCLRLTTKQIQAPELIWVLEVLQVLKMWMALEAFQA